MLRSMVDSPNPTRAEVADVANAVLDGTDAVMLSEETAVGRHPVDAVRVMRRIVAEADPRVAARPSETGGEVADLIARAACALAVEVGAAAIVVPTLSGFTARKVARHRPHVPIIALTGSERVRRQLSLVWGVTAVAVPWYADAGGVLNGFREPVRATGLAPDGAAVVVTAGWPFARSGVTNLVHVATL
jgi:pyruvate kinase